MHDAKTGVAADNLARDPSEFYQEHLDRVSRSFAFCIARLDRPLRDYVGLGYLLCRIVDTIEDASWQDFHHQEAAFAAFDRFLLSPPSRTECAEWARTFPPDIPEGESLLLQDAALIFADFHSLPRAAHEGLLAPIQSMSQGMRYFMARKAREGRLSLRDLVDVNRYCFFVAGVVGEMLTKLLQAEGVKVPLVDGFRFGLFLQKVNLLKDQSGDEKLGRYLIPSRPLVRFSLEDDARAAFRYLRSVPLKFESFRLFCAWSLFLGLASLPWIDRAAAEESRLKIPREETFQLLARIESVISDETELESLFKDLSSKAEVPAPATDGDIRSSEFHHQDFVRLYQGSLTESQILDLFSRG